jgi:hypothetical protein
MMTGPTTVTLDLTPATITSGQTTSLDLTFTNATGGAITFSSATGTTSTIGIFFPSMFSGADVGQMHITHPDWSCSPGASPTSLVLTFTGTDGTPWATGATLAFTITNVRTDMVAAPSPDPVQQPVLATLQHLTGSHVPLRVTAAPELELLAPVTPPTNPRLSDVLTVTLLQGGTVLVTPDGVPPVTNTLSLQLQNTADVPIYTGATPWSGTPTVTVTFVYGRNAEALAFDDDPDPKHPAVGSAWNIEASVSVAELNVWNAGPGGDPTPSWLLQPSNKAPGIIGDNGTGPTDTGSQITFAFDQIVSMTPKGGTRMTVAFSGFPKDEHTTYQPETFVLDIDKEVPGPTILDFSSEPKNDTGITAGQEVQLNWTTIGSSDPTPVQINVLPDGPTIISTGGPVGSTPVTPVVPTTYELLLMDDGTRPISVDIQPVAVDLAVSPAGPYDYGQSVTLTGTVDYATTYWLDPGLIPSTDLCGSTTFTKSVVLEAPIDAVLHGTGYEGPTTSTQALALKTVFANNGFVLATNGGIWRLNPDLSRSQLCQLDPSELTDMDVQGGWVAWGHRSANELFYVAEDGTNSTSLMVGAPVLSIGDTGLGMFVILLDMGETSANNVLFALPGQVPNAEFNVGEQGVWNPPDGQTCAPDTTSRIRVTSSGGGIGTIYLSNLATVWMSNSWGSQTFIPYGSGGTPTGFVTNLAATPSAVYWVEGGGPQILRTSSDQFNSATTLCEVTPTSQGLVVDGNGDVFWIEAGSAGGSALCRYDRSTGARMTMWESDEVIYALALA